MVRRIRILFLLALTACSFSRPRLEPGPPTTATAPILETTLVDAVRARSIPLRIYLPAEATPVPLIIFSHGLGNSRSGYSYLGNAWAARGYVVVFVQHADSDDSLSLPRLYRAAFDHAVWRNRPLDITYVLDEFSSSSADPVIANVVARIDMDRIGLAGHSYGAYTALVIAGGLVALEPGRRVSLADPRVDAIVALSSPLMRALTTAPAYAPIKVPILHLTGTKDSTREFATAPRHRRIPFETIANAEQYLVTLEGARHGTFSDDGDLPTAEALHPWIAEFTSTFWDGWLKNDPTARAHLKNLGSDFAVLEHKSAKP
jgi:predicted dienelactone hydrolase